MKNLERRINKKYKKKQDRTEAPPVPAVCFHHQFNSN